MAYMKFRQGNRARWVGVQPGHDGEQVAIAGNADNATVILYTVPAGKVLCLSSAEIHISGFAVGRGHMRLATDLAVVFFVPGAVVWTDTAVFSSTPFSCWPPIELLSGYQIVLYSSVAGLNIGGSFVGWLEDT